MSTFRLLAAVIAGAAGFILVGLLIGTLIWKLGLLAPIALIGAVAFLWGSPAALYGAFVAVRTVIRRR